MRFQAVHFITCFAIAQGVDGVSAQIVRCPPGERRQGPRCVPVGPEPPPSRPLPPPVPRQPPQIRQQSPSLGTTSGPRQVSVARPRCSGGQIFVSGSCACPSGMAPIPAGRFWMGSAEGSAPLEQNPQRHVTMRSFCMDRTEVTVSAYRACVVAGACTPAFNEPFIENFDTYDTRWWGRFCNAERSDADNHPINCVDWSQANEYCRWRDARLPTEAEWEYAARGPDARPYPWGNQSPGPSRLNVAGGEFRIYMQRIRERSQPQNHGGNSEVMFEEEDGWPSTSPVGSYSQGASLFGLLDMAGNVSEWTADWYGDYVPSRTVNPRGAPRGEMRVHRGGDWTSSNPEDVRSAARSSDLPSSRQVEVGFRCARGAL